MICDQKRMRIGQLGIWWIIKDFRVNLMISIDFVANLGLSEFGARMGQGSAQGPRKIHQRRQKHENTHGKYSRRNSNELKNHAKPLISPKMSEFVIGLSLIIVIVIDIVIVTETLNYSQKMKVQTHTFSKHPKKLQSAQQRPRTVILKSEPNQSHFFSSACQKLVTQLTKKTIDFLSKIHQLWASISRR